MTGGNVLECPLCLSGRSLTYTGQQQQRKHLQQKLPILQKAHKDPELHQRSSVTFAEEWRPASHRSAALHPLRQHTPDTGLYPERRRPLPPRRRSEHHCRHTIDVGCIPPPDALPPPPKNPSTNQPLPSYSLLGSLGPLHQLDYSFLSLIPPPPPLSNQGGFLAAPSSYSRSGRSVPPPPPPPLMPARRDRVRHTSSLKDRKGLYVPPNLLGAGYDALSRVETKHSSSDAGIRRQHKHEL